MHIFYFEINSRFRSQFKYCADRRSSCGPVFILSLINPRMDPRTIDETRINIGPPRQSSSSWPSRIITRKESNGSLLPGVLSPSRRDQRGDDTRERWCCFRPVRRRVTVLTGKRVRHRRAALPFDAEGVLGRICVKRLYAYRCGTWAKDKGSSESARAPPGEDPHGEQIREEEEHEEEEDEETNRRKSGREKKKEGTRKR